MRRTIPVILLVIIIAAGLGVFLARKPAPVPIPPANANGTVEVTQPVVEHNEIRLKPEKKHVEPNGDPVAAALTAQLESSATQENAPLPKGTRLLGVTVDKGVATVDFSEAFNQLNKRGDGVISLAQNTLRKSLAQFPSVKKMRVTVEGKVFEDDISGRWEDIPVRDEHTEGEP